MADSVVYSERGSTYLEENIQENASKHCRNCDKQKIKCQKTLDDLKSAQSVTELLRTEASVNGRCRFWANESKENKCISKGNEVHEENSDVNIVLMKLSANAVGYSLLDIELDMRELLELRNTAIRPWVRQVLSSVVVKLEKELMFRKCKMQNAK
jgi:hypothetical protein